MTEAEAHELIHEQWEDGWDALHPTDPGDPDHVPYTYLAEAKFTTAEVGELGAWVRFRIENTTVEQTTQGSVAKFEYRGNLFIQIFAAISHIQSDDTVLDGDKTLQTLVEDVRNVLMSKNFEGFHTFEARRQNVRESGWNACVVVVPYLFEETRPIYSGAPTSGGGPFSAGFSSGFGG